jgi:hypothetical protein
MTTRRKVIPLWPAWEKARMNVIVFASRKGGSGKSTLAAHLAAYAHRPSRPCLLIDTDPQGSLALWHRLRNDAELPLKATQRGVGDIVKAAKRDGTEWVFIDTARNMSAGRHRCDPRRHARGRALPAGRVRSRSGQRDGRVRPRAAQALCGGH